MLDTQFAQISNIQASFAGVPVAVSSTGGLLFDMVPLTGGTFVIVNCALTPNRFVAGPLSEVSAMVNSSPVTV